MVKRLGKEEEKKKIRSVEQQNINHKCMKDTNNIFVITFVDQTHFLLNVYLFINALLEGEL